MEMELEICPWCGSLWDDDHAATCHAKDLSLFPTVEWLAKLLWYDGKLTRDPLERARVFIDEYLATRPESWRITHIALTASGSVTFRATAPLVRILSAPEL